MIRSSALLLFLVAAAPGFAASSPWQASEGGAVRLVTAGLPDRRGELRGALEIRLEPGWKTYWRNPGASGVPPQIDVGGNAHVAAAEIGFPAPVRIDDGRSSWAGYKRSLALPLTFTLDRTDPAAPIEADVFIGLCETICVPFQAGLTVEPASDPDNRADAALVASAHAAVPPAASATFGVSGLERRDGHFIVRARLPEDARTAALFLAGAESARLGVPQLESAANGRARFSVEIFENGDDGLAGSVLDYTLVSGDRAVSGTAAIP